jgi:hypothetical protein
MLVLNASITSEPLPERMIRPNLVFAVSKCVEIDKMDSLGNLKPQQTEE